MLKINKRPRRLRGSQVIRDLVAETQLTKNDFIVPLFVEGGEKQALAIPSMPNYYRYSLDQLLEKIKDYYEIGLKSFLLFAKIEEGEKDNTGAAALSPDGLMQRSIRAIKSAYPDCFLMTDIALDPYSSYGHDGLVVGDKIVNDPTVEILGEMSVSHARAGADFVAPSDMMDGRIGHIRSSLDKNGFRGVGIMSYAAKYASGLYGPFRDALDSKPGFGDKKSYQMDPKNRLEALRECELDIAQGADILMIKPAGFYLDIIRDAAQAFKVPIAAYQVSGEYSMIHASAKNGWADLETVMLESLVSIKRSGANLIATYFAEEATQYLNKR